MQIGANTHAFAKPPFGRYEYDSAFFKSVAQHCNYLYANIPFAALKTPDGVEGQDRLVSEMLLCPA